MTAPMPQIRRIRNPHVGAQRGHWTMAHGPVTIDPARKQSRVLILMRHDHAKSLETPEISGERQRNTGATSCKGCVGNRILFEFRNVGDARIFDAPNFFRKVAGTRQECRLGIDAPRVDAIGRPRGTQMRKTGPVFDPAKKQRIAIGQLYCRGVEYAIDLIRPVVPILSRDDWLRIGLPAYRVNRATSVHAPGLFGRITVACGNTAIGGLDVKM